MLFRIAILKYLSWFRFVLKALDTFGKYCQRPVFHLVYLNITNLWKFGLNWSSKLRESNGRKSTIVTPCFQITRMPDLSAEVLIVFSSNIKKVRNYYFLKNYITPECGTCIKAPCICFSRWSTELWFEMRSNDRTLSKQYCVTLFFHTYIHKTPWPSGVYVQSAKGETCFLEGQRCQDDYKRRLVH